MMKRFAIFVIAVSCLFGFSAVGRTLVVPAGVRSIGALAYFGDNSLDSVIFESGSRLETIGEYAFADCQALRHVSLPGSVTSLGEGCFSMCPRLESLRVPARVSTLPRYFCAGDSLLEEVSLPARLKDIGSHAFIDCASLRKLAIPQSVTHIGSNAFSGCSALERMEMPRNMRELESYAFSGCSALKSVTLPANDRMLGELLFSDCPALEEIIVPSALPPTFDCGTPPFEPDSEMYSKVRLIVPAPAASAYRAAPGWCLFTEITSEQTSATPQPHNSPTR